VLALVLLGQMTSVPWIVTTSVVLGRWLTGAKSQQEKLSVHVREMLSALSRPARPRQNANSAVNVSRSLPV